MLRKRRPLAVTKIYMPDFRHAHTLQQYYIRPKAYLELRSLSVVLLCHVFFVLFVALFVGFVLFVVSFICLLLYRDPRGYSKSNVWIVVVCGHDESPAYKSWLRPEASFSSTFFKSVSKRAKYVEKYDPSGFLAPISGKSDRFRQKVVGSVKKWPVPSKSDAFSEKVTPFCEKVAGL